jgi:ABC-type glycerol-3-phosphate transport system substrate-binding protein
MAEQCSAFGSFRPFADNDGGLSEFAFNFNGEACPETTKEGETMLRRAFLQQAAAWAGVAATGTILAACTNRQQASQESGIPLTGKQVTVRFPEGTASEPEQRFAQAVIERVQQKYPNIRLEVDGDWGSLGWQQRYEKYITMTMAGTAPEILWLCCTYIRPFMEKGMALDLDPYIKRSMKAEELADFYPGPLEGMKVEGKQMALPAYINTNLMFLNRDQLNEAGLSYPDDNWTREQFLEYAQKLTKRQGQEVERWGFDMPFDGIDRLVSWIWSMGGELHDPKDVTRFLFDQPKTIEAVTFMHDLIWKHRVAPANTDMRWGLSLADAFINGKTAIVMGASGDAATYSLRINAFNWDFAPLTKGPGGYGARISMDGYMISRETKIPGESWLVLYELVSSEVNVLRAELRRLQPPRRSAAQAWERIYPGKQARLGRLLSETARPDPRAFWKDADEVGQIVGRHLTATFRRNEYGPAEAMRRIVADVNAYYRK